MFLRLKITQVCFRDDYSNVDTLLQFIYASSVSSYVTYVSSLQSRQRLALPPERPMNGERPERNRDRTGTGTTGTERRSVLFLAYLAFPVVPVHSSEKMERCLLKLSCYQTKRNLTFKTI